MLAVYRGKSFVSRLIKFFTWSKYSHVSWITKSGMEYEAWHKGPGYQCVIFGENHIKGTFVDIFELVDFDSNQRRLIEIDMRYYINKKIKYDFIGCTRFLTHINRGNKKKFFCSEAIMTIFNDIKYYILERIVPWKVSPAMITYSPKLKFIKRIRIGDDISSILAQIK